MFPMQVSGDIHVAASFDTPVVPHRSGALIAYTLVDFTKSSDIYVADVSGAVLAVKRREINGLRAPWRAALA
jgi:hypothetical protein